MKSFILPLLAALIAFSSCHPNNGNNVTPSNDIWGDLIVTRRTSDSNFIIPGIDDELSTAQFYSSANSYFTVLPVTRVSANSYRLDDNGDTQYVGTPGPGIDTHVQWDVDGGSRVPSFSYDEAGPFPQYTGPKVPDTIARTNGFTMSFPAAAVTPGDSVSIVFNEYEQYQSKDMDQNRNIIFTAQELGRLHAGTNYVNLNISHITYRTFEGKQYYFAKNRTYMSSVFVR